MVSPKESLKIMVRVGPKLCWQTHNMNYLGYMVFLDSLNPKSNPLSSPALETFGSIDYGQLKCELVQPRQ